MEFVCLGLGLLLVFGGVFLFFFLFWVPIIDTAGCSGILLVFINFKELNTFSLLYIASASHIFVIE